MTWATGSVMDREEPEVRIHREKKRELEETRAPTFEGNGIGLGCEIPQTRVTGELIALFSP